MTQDFVTGVVANVSIAVLTLLGAYAVNAVNKLTIKVKAQTALIKTQEKRSLLDNAIADINELVTKTVTNIEQTTAKAIRQAVKDGSVDENELKRLAERAYREVAESLKPDTKIIIDKNYGNFSKYLSKCIETKVYELKLKE